MVLLMEENEFKDSKIAATVALIILILIWAGIVLTH